MKSWDGKLWWAVSWGITAVWIVLLIVAVHYAWRALVADTFIVPSDSMRPTLLPGDRVKVDKTIFGARLYTSLDFTGGRMESVRTRGRRGLRCNDIIVFNFPLDDKGRIGFKMNYVYVKRVVALPGDTIAFVHSRPVNSHFEGTIGIPSEQRVLEETPDSLIPRGVMHNVLTERSVLGYTIKDIPPVYVPRRGDILRMDDWRKVEIYRRVVEWETGGILTWNEVGGCCLLDGGSLPYYRFRKNYYFVCGDHALNSRDSRYWGFVPEDHIVGKPVLVWLSLDKDRGWFEGHVRWDRLFRLVDNIK